MVIFRWSVAWEYHFKNELENLGDEVMIARIYQITFSLFFK